MQAETVALARSLREQRPPSTLDAYLAQWEAFFDRYASQVEAWHARNAGYHDAIARLAGFYVPPGARILEIGSGTGDLLASLKPSYGVGVDLSRVMVDVASRRHPELRFHHTAAEKLDLPGQTFDYVVLSDLLGFLFDIGEAFRRIRAVCHSRTRVVMHWYSRLWQPILAAAETLGRKHPLPLLNWTTPQDVRNLLYLAGFETVREGQHILAPARIPLLATLANRFLAHLPLLRSLCLTRWIVARPLGLPALDREPRVSVVCPCRNEAGNIEEVVRRLPSMGASTELLFVEGHSTDDTLAACQRAAQGHPEREIRVLVQEGKGKGDAVRLGFSQATGDVLMILDADLSVAPEDLPRFLETLVRGQAELVNGSRAVYAMDPAAMRFLNLLGNRAFALIVRALLGQEVKDTLCGTKVLRRSDYERIAQGRSYFGELDPFGDFDLLFGAAKLGLRIVDLPVRYRERTYGTTNIHRFRDGFRLLRMCARAAMRLVFLG